MRLTTLSLVAVLGSLAAASCLPAMADTIYTYTGKDFTSDPSPYTDTSTITGSFTTAAPLGDSFSGYIVPLSYSFTDGEQTLDQTNSTDYNTFFTISTDLTGQVTSWDIFLGSLSDSSEFISTTTEQDQTGLLVFETAPPGDLFTAEDDGPVQIGVIVYGGNSGTPGTWSPVTVTPEPSSLLLFGTGILGVAGVARRRFLPR
jgi:hypothetical protein